MRVPTYKSESKLSNRSGGINMGVRANPGALSAGSQAMASFGDQAMETSLKFYEMERKNDYEAQKQNGIVSYAKELESIKEQSRLQPSNTADTYFDTKAKKAQDKIANTFTNDVAKKDYLNESEIDFINKRVSVRSYNSNRRINDQAGTHLARVNQLQYDAINGNKAEKHAAFNELFGDKPNKIDGIFDKLKNLGYYNAPQSIAQTNKMMASITEGNVVNTFEALSTLEDKKNFIESFKKSPPVSLSNIKKRQLIRGFRTEVNGLAREQKLAKREFKSDIKEQSDVLKRGGNVPDEIINGFDLKAKNLNDGDSIELVRRLNLQKTIMGGLKKASPPEVQSYINDVRKKGFEKVEGVGLDSRFEVDLVKDMESFLTNMRTQLKKDPITYAAKTGVIKDFVPLNFESPNTLGDTLFLRKQQATKMSARYDIPIQYFTQDELSAVTAKLQESSSDQKMALFATIQSVFGSKTKDVLVELNQKGPEFAHIGGLLLTKNIDSATLAMQGSDLIKNNVQPIEYTTTNTKIPYIDIVSASLSELSPTVNGSAEKIAKNIYTKLAYDSGSTSFDSNLFEEAVQRSLGGVYDKDGELAAGGIQAVNDHQTLLPSSISPDMFEEMIEVLEPFNFETNNIDPSLLNDIKDGDFVFYAFGNGVYKLAREKRVGGSTRQYASDLDGNELILNALDFFEQEQL
mgnify:FL=1